MKVVFSNRGTFQALYAAQEWCSKNGISYAPLCAGMPVGLMRGEVSIAKWKNLTPQERNQCHGTMTGEFREGLVTIEMKDGA